MLLIPEISADSFRPSTPVLLACCVLGCMALVSCATNGPVGPFITASATIQLPANLPYDEAKQQALQTAEIHARHELLRQFLDLDFSRDDQLERRATADPYIRAQILDLIRTGRISSRGIDDNGRASVAVELSRESVDQLLVDLATP